MTHPRAPRPLITMAVLLATVSVHAQLAKGATKFLGNCSGIGMGAPRTGYAELWTQMTPEVEGLWRNVEPQRDRMNWTYLDSTYDYCKRNGLLFKQDAFAIGNSQPAWFSSVPPDTFRAEFEEWVAEYAARYPDTRIATVVSEPQHSRPAWALGLGGAGVTGYDWAIEVFRIVRRHLPHAILVLEDYNVLRYETDSFMNIAKKVKEAGFLDAVGCEGHMLETMSAADLKAALEKVATLGVPIYITQYDVAKENDSLQKEVLSRQFPVFWESPHVAGITMWGYVYGRTQNNGAGLVKNGVERPALTWLRDYVAKNPIQPMPVGGLRNDGTIQGPSTGVGHGPVREDGAAALPNGTPKDLDGIRWKVGGISRDALGRP